MKRLHSRVIANEPIADQCYRLAFTDPGDEFRPLPGQFLTIRVAPTTSPLLRRPFAYAGHDSTAGESFLIYERRGPATSLLTAFRPGDALDVLGPVGNAFPIPRTSSRVVLAGGGIGMGPVLFQYRALQAAGMECTLILGARTAARLPLGMLGPDVIVATDDGTAGIKGNVVTAMESVIPSMGPSPSFQFCGPHPMMAAAGAWARGRFPEAPIHVSMEQTMACAVGACMGCVIPVRGDRPWARVCAEGPVFDYDFIVWD